MSAALDIAKSPYAPVFAAMLESFRHRAGLSRNRLATNAHCDATRDDMSVSDRK